MHTPSILTLLAVGLAARVALLAWAEWQDAVSPVKYTDIDYAVFTDGAAAVAAGGSPYDRATYRYTPLLAWLLVPNVTCFALWGKLVFVAADMLVAWLLAATLAAAGCPEPARAPAVAAWILNPIVAAISTRGSAEALIVLPVIATVAALAARRDALAGALLGLAVHVKLYPVVYAPAFVIALAPPGPPSLTRWVWANSRAWVFGLAALASFGALTASMYYLYGETFLDQAFLYHVRRTDPRHNFSLYFYPMYLADTAGAPAPDAAAPGALGLAIRLLTSPFAPQMALCAILGMTLARIHLPSALFVVTLAFVAFNKVITSQYFVWFYALLPLATPASDLSWRGWIAVFTTFTAGQATWLSRAYHLEFAADPSMFPQLWWASALFLLLNAFLIAHPAISTSSTAFERAKEWRRKLASEKEFGTTEPTVLSTAVLNASSSSALPGPSTWAGVSAFHVSEGLVSVPGSSTPPPSGRRRRRPPPGSARAAQAPRTPATHTPADGDVSGLLDADAGTAGQPSTLAADHRRRRATASTPAGAVDEPVLEPKDRELVERHEAMYGRARDQPPLGSPGGSSIPRRRRRPPPGSARQPAAAPAAAQPATGVPLARNPDQTTRFDPARRSPTAKRVLQTQASAAALAEGQLSGERLRQLALQRGGFTGGIQDPQAEADDEYALRPAFTFKAPISDDPVVARLRPHVLGTMSDVAANASAARGPSASGSDLEAARPPVFDPEADGLYVGRQPQLGKRNWQAMKTRLGLEDELAASDPGAKSLTRWLRDGELVVEADLLKDRVERPTHFPTDTDVLFQVVQTKPVPSAQGVVLESRPNFFTLNVAVEDVEFLDHPLFREEELLARALQLMYAKYVSLRERDLVVYWSLRLAALTDALAAALADAGSDGSDNDENKGLALDTSLDASFMRRSATGKHARLGPVSLTRSQSYVFQVDQADLEAMHAEDHASHIRKLKHDIREARRNLDIVELDERVVIYDMIQTWTLLKAQRADQGLVATPVRLVFRTTATNEAEDREARAREIEDRVAEAADEAEALHQAQLEAYAAAMAEYEAHCASAAQQDPNNEDADADEDEDAAGPSAAADAGDAAENSPRPALEPPSPPPPLDFDADAARAQIEEHLTATKRAPGAPILVPVLSLDMPLTADDQVSAAEASRRADLRKVACHIRLVANEVNVTETSSAKLVWPDRSIPFHEGFGLQLFSWPQLKLQLYSSGLFKSLLAETELSVPGEAGALQVGENADFDAYYLVAPSAMKTQSSSHTTSQAVSLLAKYLPRSARQALIGDADAGSGDTLSRHTVAKVRVRLAWGASPTSDGLAAAPRRPPGLHRLALPNSIDALSSWACEHDMDPSEPQNAAVLEALAGGSTALATPANIERLKNWVRDFDLDPNDPRNATVLHLLSGLGGTISNDSGLARAVGPGGSPKRGANVFGALRGGASSAAQFRTGAAAHNLVLPGAFAPGQRRLDLLALRWQRPIAYSGPIPLEDSAIREAWFDAANDSTEVVIARDQYVARVREMTATAGSRRGYDSRRAYDFAEVVAERPPPTFGLAFAGILEWFQPRRRFKPTRETRIAKTVAVHRAELVIKVVRGYSIPDREPLAGELPGANSPLEHTFALGAGAATGASTGNITLPGNAPEPENQVEPVVQIRFQDSLEWTHKSLGANPVWNDTIVFDITPPDGNFKPEVLATMQDVVYFNIFDSKVAPFENFMDEDELKFIIPRHNVWLGTFGLPFSTIYSNSLLQGRFHVNVPLVSPGYVRERAPASVAVEHISPYAPTMLELYITTRPALEPPRAVAEKSVSRETPEFLAHARKWEKAVRGSSSFGNRVLEVLVADQSRASVFVCRYIRPMAPPAELTTARQILRYVSLIPFLSDSAAFAGRRHVWNTMDEFFEYGVGDEEEHALLLANYFLHSGLRAYVVLGRGIPEGETAYVLTIGDAGQVHLWNAHAGKVYSAHDPDIPLRSIGMVFNEHNLWANIQEEDAPWVMSYNIHNTSQWKPFFTRAFSPSLDTVQPPSIDYAPVLRDTVDDVTRQVRKAIRESLEKWRLAENLSIRFNSQCNLALRDLLERFERHYQGIEVLPPDAHRAELSRLLTTYDITGFPVHMPFTHVDPLVEAVRNTGVHLNKHPRSQCALAVFVHPYPNNVLAVWVYVASLTPRDL
ncbi:coiled-coil and C2 domain-containing protein 2A [Thecamonas trahens ATCC 50062]|uniref:Coiled-coil and C2 domain-containing protein 2A n=1 Tax=Thecamonas trahens ATCC 50062 TaxID=461836 RepID=A0A0L0DBK0_THETB|nr:coiled-coil and C2 domain-containing protein 2A [Thecamonas trahens ATCC 50062]KNC48673.1 coiled-coil and C2 domain-containing protein 2A [Thecamonas trahens ATCC 50062]|eukprot:XP_013762729.1 coiled-coil and C2 domain-containing protein 2A [Thecamonas trahens ATCC 50062]